MMKVVENQHDPRVPFADLANGDVFNGSCIKGKRYAGTEWVTCYTSLYSGQVYDVVSNETTVDGQMLVYKNPAATVVVEGLE